jgi:hypothetical protein
MCGGSVACEDGRTAKGNCGVVCAAFGGRTSSRCPPYTTTNEDVSQAPGFHTGLNTTHLPTDRLSSNSATQPSHPRRCFPHRHPARSSSAVLSPHPRSVLAPLSRPLRDHARRSHVALKLRVSPLRSGNSASHRPTPRRRL